MKKQTQTGRARRWFAQAGAALALGAATAVCAAQATVPVKHARGETAVPANPAKTVVMDLAVLDTLHALGVEVTGVPSVAKLPPQLAQYADPRYLKVGTMFEPNYEVIHAAAPQVIFVAGRSAPKYDELARLAPTVDLTVDAKDLVGSVTRNTETLAAIYGKQAQATEKLNALRASISALNAKASGAGSALIVLTTGGKMSAYGPGSRFGVIHDAFGVKPATTGLSVSNHGQAISFEFIAQTDPDWLFVIDRDAAIGREGVSAQRMLDNELVRQTKAWKQKRVVYLNGYNWYLMGSAGLTAMQQNVDEIAGALAAGK
ncbi:siderophore ABC transporter substrate-binding protein [Achromobacter denitrificans]|uniref:siderophore ABC transporter substrate-binding protein n=1 Tax=Achromobacter denitrificans TaxID=32002 RepID=UPI00240D2EE9|nr:siderophore ABC transporter substrate-binding protein [Achromobacter denitrificans]MBV2161176.1 siderophore ABC transporter substrate-binding protein [Achromobacter denitrificans]MDX3878018.1 siderophore ABC transporter substrate-binding protein [Achromobacter sp.]WFC64899.1 siderophore ABC transporter substrate-binding protein [Achromobacter denitrificans]